MSEGFKLVSGGTDNHMMLIDLSGTGVTGKVAEAALGLAGVTVNKNSIPFDTEKPMVTSGVRIGTPTLTTRGMKEPEMKTVASLIARALKTPEDEAVLGRIADDACDLAGSFPVFAW